MNDNGNLLDGTGRLRLTRLDRKELNVVPDLVSAPDVIVRRWVSGEYLHRKKASTGYNYAGLALAYSGYYHYQSHGSIRGLQSEGRLRILLRNGELAIIGRRLSSYLPGSKSRATCAEFDSVFSELYRDSQQVLLAVIFGLVDRSGVESSDGEEVPIAAPIDLLSTDRLLKPAEKQKERLGLLWLNVTDFFRDGDVAIKHRHDFELRYQFLTNKAIS
jgi:hypothetical protein